MKQLSVAGGTRTWLLPLGAGLAAGVVAGLFGVGGGVLLVPVLVLVLGRSQHVAHATSLVAITIVALAGAIRFAADDAVAWMPAVAIAVGAVAGTQVGARLAHRVPERELRWLFAALLALTAVRLAVTGGDDASGVALSLPTFGAEIAATYTALGIAAGTASALLGVGGGIVIVPGLVVLLGFGQHIAEGTSLAVIVPTAIIGAATHARREYTDWRTGLRLGVGGAVGAVIGVQIALSLPGVTLARAFAGLLAVVAVLLAFRGATDSFGREKTAETAPVRLRDRRRIVARGTSAPERDRGTGAPADLTVAPLTTGRRDDFLAFFEGPIAGTGGHGDGCYCYFDRYPGPADEFDLIADSTKRDTMTHLLDTGLVRGWLAYLGEQPVGWCHAASRIELPHLKVDAPTPGRQREHGATARRRVGVIACFVVVGESPRRTARALLDAAVTAFAKQGMGVVEAYPSRTAADFRGAADIYADAGFRTVTEFDDRTLVRRRLDIT